MTGTLPAAAPSRQKQQAKTRSRAKQVTGSLKVALDLLVRGDEEGNALELHEAAKRAGLTTRAVRLAIAKSHVRAYMRKQRDLLTAELGATNIAHIASLRTSSNQMVRVQSCRLLEEIAGTVERIDRSPTRGRVPGITIIIASPPTRPMVDDKPLLHTIEAQPDDTAP